MGRARGRLPSRTAGPVGTFPWAQDGLVGVCGGSSPAGCEQQLAHLGPPWSCPGLSVFSYSVFPLLHLLPLAPLLCPLT